MGTPKFIASWSYVQLALRLMVGIWSENSVMEDLTLQIVESDANSR